MKNIKINKKLFIILIPIILFLFCFFNFISLNKIKGEIGDILTYQNGNIKLDVYNVSEENQNIKMHYKDTNKIEITIDFNDYSETNRYLNIKLAEGLKFSSLPVLEVTDSSYQTKISESNTLYNAISSVNTEKIKVEDNYVNTSNKTIPNSVYGEVSYKIKKEVKQITITFNISSDLFRYYGEHIIENGIDVEVMCGGQTLDDIKKNIKLFDKENKDNDLKFFSIYSQGYSYNKRIKASTTKPENIEFGNYLYVSNTFMFNNTNISGLPKFKNVIYDLYYPEGTAFETLIGFNHNELSNIAKYENIPVDRFIDENGNLKVKELNYSVIAINYPDENKVSVIYVSNIIDASILAVKYKVNDVSYFNNELNNAGDFVKKYPPQKSLAKVTFYDGNTIEMFIDDTKTPVEIWYPYDVPNLMDFNRIYSGQDQNNAYDDENDSTFIFGPYFPIENTTPSEKTNQVLEYIIDPNYQVVGVSFPRKDGVKVKDIQYQLSTDKETDKWHNYNGEIIYVSEKNTIKFTIDDAGIDDPNAYFIAIRGTVEKYEENYNSVGGAHKGEANAVLYGNLKSTANEAVITLNIYESGNENLKKTLTKKVFRNTDRKTISSRNYIGESSFDKSVVLTGDRFNYNYRIATYQYPYGNTMIMDDVYIYIREPKDLILNLSELKLTYKNNKYNENEKLDEVIIDGYNLAEGVEIEKVTRKNDSIYIIKTNRNIGFGLSKRELLDATSRYLLLNASYKVKEDSNLTSIKNIELVSWGNLDYEFIVHTMKDNYDFNNNGSIEDDIPLIAQETLSIQKANSFVASTHIIKDGIEYDSYNEDNKDTIINLDYKESFEYNIKLINNTDKAAKYNILIPIPKKGIDFGPKFQEEEFTWNINLLKEIAGNEDFEISYNVSEDVNNMDFVPYSKNIDLNDVNMIKLSSVKEIPIGKEYIFKIDLGLNSKPDDNKKTNIWNPVSYLEASDLTGEFKGSKVAIDINYKEISGLMYLDINKNKVYDKNIDIPGVSDLEIELFKLENEEYTKVKDLEISNLTGEFILDDIKLLKNNIFALKFNSGLFMSNSDMLKENWVNDIDFTKENKYYYEIGYVTDEFAPIIKAEDSYIYVGDKIEFEKYIKEAYDYKKEKIEFVFGKNTTYKSDIPNSHGVATKAGIYYTTYEVTDKYGNKGSVLIKIYVREKPMPPSTNDDLTKHIILGIFSIMLLGFSRVLYERQKG